MRNLGVAVTVGLLFSIVWGAAADAQDGLPRPFPPKPTVFRPQPYAKVYYVDDLVEVRVPESLENALDRYAVTVQQDLAETRGNLSWFSTRMCLVASLTDVGHRQLAAYLAEARGTEND